MIDYVVSVNQQNKTKIITKILIIFFSQCDLLVE